MYVISHFTNIFSCVIFCQLSHTFPLTMVLLLQVPLFYWLKPTWQVTFNDLSYISGDWCHIMMFIYYEIGNHYAVYLWNLQPLCCLFIMKSATMMTIYLLWNRLPWWLFIYHEIDYHDDYLFIMKSTTMMTIYLSWNRLPWWLFIYYEIGYHDDYLYHEFVSV